MLCFLFSSSCIWAEGLFTLLRLLSWILFFVFSFSIRPLPSKLLCERVLIESVASAADRLKFFSFIFHLSYGLDSSGRLISYAKIVFEFVSKKPLNGGWKLHSVNFPNGYIWWNTSSKCLFLQSLRIFRGYKPLP